MLIKQGVVMEQEETLCPECGSKMDSCHREGDMLAPEADWYVCPECGYETDPE